MSELSEITQAAPREAWQAAIVSLCGRFSADYRNHRILNDPWTKAAHCMVQGWRNIRSQGRLGHVPKPPRRIFTWEEAVQSMRQSYYGRKRSRLMDPTTWRFWASHLSRVHLRYIPKRQQADQADE